MISLMPVNSLGWCRIMTNFVGHGFTPWQANANLHKLHILGKLGGETAAPKPEMMS